MLSDALAAVSAASRSAADAWYTAAVPAMASVKSSSALLIPFATFV